MITLATTYIIIAAAFVVLSTAYYSLRQKNSLFLKRYRVLIFVQLYVLKSKPLCHPDLFPESSASAKEKA